ncbi:MAG: CHRD domain-containing protein [Planctomycetota bacterium]
MNHALSVSLVAAIAGSASAQITEFSFQGNAGFGLLPGNEAGNNTPVSAGVGSPAFGGEVGGGLAFDASTNILSFDFEFSGLSGGLFDAVSGIHFHEITSGAAPFDGTGGIVFNLNSGDDANVSLSSPLVAIGSTDGRVTGTAQFAASQVDALFAGNFYLNIHSGDFTGGELRGSLVPIPAPASGVVLAGLGLVAGRRR